MYCSTIFELNSLREKSGSYRISLVVGFIEASQFKCDAENVPRDGT
jgi:hypothetical protein